MQVLARSCSASASRNAAKSSLLQSRLVSYRTLAHPRRRSLCLALQLGTPRYLAIAQKQRQP